MIDKTTIKINGVLYAGEHRSDHLFVENFTPKDGKEYAMRVRATDGNVYLAEFKDGKTLIEQCFIPRAGHLNVELCEKIGEEYISLSAVFMFPVFESIDETEDTPPPYEQAKSLAERAIEAADRAEEIADSIGTGGGAVTDEQIQNAVNDYLKENPIEVDIPDSLPNPNALTFTGAVSATYNGSAPVTVNIPSGGSGGASERWRLLKTVVIPADVASDTSDVTWYSNAENNVMGFLVDTDDNGNSFVIEDFRIFGIATTSEGTDSLFLGESANKNMLGYRCSSSKTVPCFYDVSFNRFENTAFPAIGFASQYAQVMTYCSFFANDAGYANSGNTFNGLVNKFDTPLKSIYLSHYVSYFTSGKFYIYAKEAM